MLVGLGFLAGQVALTAAHPSAALAAPAAAPALLAAAAPVAAPVASVALPAAAASASQRGIDVASHQHPGWVVVADPAGDVMPAIAVLQEFGIAVGAVVHGGRVVGVVHATDIGKALGRN